ncbi:MAG: coniferyl aldehyde dehydrogenase [Pseudoxanthomonas sp.]
MLTPTPVAPLEASFGAIKTASLDDGIPRASVRIDRLKRLESILVNHQNAWCKAIDEDFNGRPPIQTRMEIYGALTGLRHAIKHVAHWMKPEPRPLPLIMRATGAKAEVVFQPMGVVGVVSPWNFPLVLSIGALGSVFSAGNRTMLKPSELAPATSELTKRLLDASFDPLELTTALGGANVGQAFSSLPFDHLLFTGAPSVAKQVMRAAAENLVPVTLELGGKCPVVIGLEADWDLAVDRVMWGKIQNAGQICLAPDYVLVPRGREQEFIRRAKEKMAKWYDAFKDNPDFCAIINEHHFARLQGYIDEARERGTQLEFLGNLAEAQPAGGRKLAPTIFVQPDEDLRIMQDEVFGPLLSLRSYGNLDEAIAFINARPRPLALYYFGNDRHSIQALKSRTTSGGMTVNDIATHASTESLPLGGVGNSGMGAYHGRDGFLNFSHKKAVLTQRKISLGKMFNPPYTARQSRMLDKVIGKPMR